MPRVFLRGGKNTEKHNVAPCVIIGGTRSQKSYKEHYHPLRSSEGGGREWTWPRTEIQTKFHREKITRSWRERRKKIYPKLAPEETCPDSKWVLIAKRDPEHSLSPTPQLVRGQINERGRQQQRVVVGWTDT